MIIKLLLLVIIGLSIKYIRDMLQYKPNSSLQNISTKLSDVRINEDNKEPIVITDETRDIPFNSFDDIITHIPGYMIKDNNKVISLELLLNSQEISIHKNETMVTDFQLDDYFTELLHIISSYYLVGQSNYMSMYRGNHIVDISKNSRNYLILSPISGSITLYLFNPKHEKDIKNQTLHKCKKWAIKSLLTTKQIIVIPTEWYYAYETNNDVILFQTESDTYFTYVFNYIRR